MCVSNNKRVTNNKRHREGDPPKRHRQIQDMWKVSCWHEDDNERKQGLVLLKKAKEILASKNNNRAKIVATRAQCATTHKMHIYRESNNSRIQTKQRRSERAQEYTEQKHTKLRSPKRGKPSKEEGVRAKQEPSKSQARAKQETQQRQARAKQEH